MQPSRLSNGALITTIGWLLSADAIIGAVAVVMVWSSVAEFGGQYPPFVIYFLMWPLLITGGTISYHGARLLHKKAALVLPVAGAAVLVYMLPYVMCIPGLCFNP